MPEERLNCEVRISSAAEVYYLLTSFACAFGLKTHKSVIAELTKCGTDIADAAG